MRRPLQNISYPDPLEGKIRELDARAMTFASAVEKPKVWVTLLVECSNNSQPLALMTKPQLPRPLAQDAVPVVGIPLAVDGEHVRRVLRLDEFHHCCTGSVASQFCSFQQKKDATKEWMATHDEGQWSSIKKLGDVLIHDEQEYSRTWVPPANDREEPVNLTFYYCALVLQGHLFDVDARAADPKPQPIRMGLLRRSVSWHREAHDYFIDVVTEPALPEYLDVLEKERDEIARRVEADLARFTREAQEEARERLRGMEHERMPGEG